MAEAVKRAPGRPRSEASHLAILAAASRLIDRGGYNAMTIDTLAAEAGTGRQTIYRWWPTKADVVLELVAPAPEYAIAVPDTGAYRTDLAAFIRAAFEAASLPHTQDLLRGLMTEAQLRDDFGARFRERFLQPRRAAFAVILQRAASRGELPARPSIDTVADIVFGVLWYRMLATRAPLDEQLVGELASLLSSGGS